jgi:hypothetical protein
MAKRTNAKTIEVKASHLSLISHPDEITRRNHAADPRSNGTASLTNPAHAQRKGQGAMKRFGSAIWNGGLREGNGSVSTESRALEAYPSRSSAATVKSRAPIRRNCLGRLTPPASPCRSSDCLAW